MIPTYCISHCSGIFLRTKTYLLDAKSLIGLWNIGMSRQDHDGQRPIEINGEIKNDVTRPSCAVSFLANTPFSVATTYLVA